MNKAKAEAEKIVEKFKDHTFHHSDKSIWDRRAKNCAFIHVNKMLEEIKFSRDYIPEYFWKTRDKHWLTIKEELENI